MSAGCLLGGRGRPTTRSNVYNTRHPRRQLRPHNHLEQRWRRRRAAGERRQGRGRLCGHIFHFRPRRRPRRPRRPLGCRSGSPRADRVMTIIITIGFRSGSPRADRVMTIIIIIGWPLDPVRTTWRRVMTIIITIGWPVDTWQR